MDQTAVREVTARKTEQEIMKLMDVFSKSDVSIRSFCEANNVTTSSFHYWKKKYRRSAEDSRGKTGFSTLEISTSAALFAEVGNIKIYQPVSAAYLRELSA